MHLLPEPAEGALRLMNGTSNHSSQGRLEVYHNADWGSVCDNEWGLPDTKVACRQLGFKGADTFTSGAEFGKGSGQVWLDAVACKGNEKRLDECLHSGWASTECTHEMDIGLTCSYTEGETIVYKRPFPYEEKKGQFDPSITSTTNINRVRFIYD